MKLSRRHAGADIGNQPSTLFARLVRPSNRAFAEVFLGRDRSGRGPFDEIWQPVHVGRVEPRLFASNAI